ncbi:nucleotidyltransferase family protein [Celeribacter sp.]|uniref:nucleotidyltransferase family protein n=1 Tax=Celeribacter sp. TaxID=1890673 RepID=UPI003A8DC42B
MRNRPDTVMLFCAGRGTRMGTLTNDRPKPMVEVAGRPLVDHALDQVAAIPTKIANTHYLPEALDSHLSQRGVKTIFEPQLLETGGGLKNAAPHIKGDAVFTMNTDAVWLSGHAVDALLTAWNPDVMDALLLTVPHGRAHGHLGSGDFSMAADGQLNRGGDLVYTGLQIIKLAPVVAIEDTAFSMNVVWNAIHEKSRLFGAVFDGAWCDVGHPEGIASAEAALRGDTHV